MKWLFGLLLAVGICLHAPTAVASALDAPTQYVEVDGYRIAYRSLGKGPAMVLANRMRGTLDTWDPLFLDELAKTHRVIIYDFPGVGYSSGSLPPSMDAVADTTVAFTRQLGLKRFILVGWSWGGAMSQVLLTEHPDLVSQAVLIGTNPPGNNALGPKDIWLERAIKPVNDLADEEILFFEPKSAFSRATAKASHDRIHKRNGVTERIPSKPEAIQAFFDAAGLYKADMNNRRQKLTQLDTPILILCGDNDTIVPAANWFPLIGQLPNAQLIVYPQAGHGPQHQHPELSVRYINDFLKYSSP